MNFSIASYNTSSLILILGARNVTFESIGAIFDFATYTETVTWLYITCFIGTAFLGFILNVTSCFVFLIGKRFQQKNNNTYSYLRISTLFSLIINMLQIFFGLVASRRFVSSMNTYIVQFCTNYFILPLHNSLLFYRFLFDSVVILDRLTTLKPKLKRFVPQSPLKNSIIVFIIVLILNIPHYFLYSMVKYDIYSMSKQEMFVMYFIDASAYGKSLAGRIIYIILIFYRHLLPLCIEIALNCISLKIFRAQVRKKAQITNVSISIMRLTSYSQRKSEKKQQQKKSKEQKNNIKNSASRWKNSERQLTKMILCLGLISIIVQFAFMLQFFYIYFVNLSLLITFVQVYTCVLKHAINFFVYYFFNASFRQYFNRWLTLKVM